jgi:adenosylmethionine-8-amino-7-oxononanoate aminotransferase
MARGISRGEVPVLAHGPTYMGNPLACAVANASIELLLSADWRAAVSRISAGLQAGLSGTPGVRDVRVLGAIGVIQLHQNVDMAAATAAAVEHGVWLRPFRDLIYTMPPYVATDLDIAAITRGMRAAAAACVG